MEHNSAGSSPPLVR